jgi:hypothetical protein
MIPRGGIRASSIGGKDRLRQGDWRWVTQASSGENEPTPGDRAPRVAEWLWELAEANDIVVHIHPPMTAVGHEVLIPYRLNEAIGRPFDSTINVAR